MFGRVKERVQGPAEVCEALWHCLSLQEGSCHQDPSKQSSTDSVGPVPRWTWRKSANVRKRAAACIECGGGHFKHLLKRLKMKLPRNRIKTVDNCKVMT